MLYVVISCQKQLKASIARLLSLSIVTILPYLHSLPQNSDYPRAVYLLSDTLNVRIVVLSIMVIHSYPPSCLHPPLHSPRYPISAHYSSQF